MKATTKNTPRAILGQVLKENSHFKKLDETNLVAGLDIVMTASNVPCLYMGDDPRKNPPIQIMVSFFNGELGYLPIERKQAIEWVMEEKE